MAGPDLRDRTGEPPVRSRFVRVLGNLVLLSISLGVTLLLAEFAVRVVAPQQLIVIRPDIWLPVDSLGWMHQPGLDTEINTGEGPARLITDAEGFRRGELSPREAATEVLLIGDSFMAALQVDHEQTLAGLMEVGLASDLGHPVAVRNAGVGGWDPPHYLIRGRSLLARDTYDLMVVTVYMGNDVVPRAVERYPPVQPVSVARLRFPRALSGAELVDAVLRPVNDFLETRSHLFTLLKTRLEVVRMRMGLTAAYFPDGFRTAEAEDGKWDVTVGLLEELAREADRHGVPTLFILIPADFQVDQEVFERHVAGFGLDADGVDLDQPNRIIREGLEANGREVLDPLPFLRAALADGQRTYGLVDTHFNPDGHRLVWELSGERMAEILKETSGSMEGAQQGIPGAGTPSR